MNKVMECRDIVKTYTDGSRVLQILTGVNLEIYSGEILAISGPSGVGKSTLLHLMGTLDTPTSGEIYFQDNAYSKMSNADKYKLRNEHIGFVFQFYHLLPEFTALENVMMPALCKGKGKQECLNRAEELLEKVGLKERITHKPGQLSGGEQQRVAIARALFNKPSVILCDEPTGNLDEITGQKIVELLWELNASENMTLVMATHDFPLARTAHRWMNLHEGRTEVKSES